MRALSCPLWRGLPAACNVSILGLALASCASAGSAGGEDKGPPPPTITRFLAEPASISAGEASQLTALFEHGEGTIGSGVGAVTSGLGVTVHPPASTVYVLTVADAAGRKAESSATVIVGGLPPTVTVLVSPHAAELDTGASATFVATVTGTGNTAVTWRVLEDGGGNVTAGGLYTAPPAAGTYHIEATSEADPQVGDTAMVTVSAPGVVVVPDAPGVIVPDAPGAADLQIALDTTSSHPISRFVYGVNLMESSSWGTLPANIGLSRMGGNRLSCYNWENSYSNAGSDWNYQSDENLVLSGDHALGAATKRRADFAFARGAAFMATVPNIGYVAKDASGPVATPFPNFSRFFVSAPKNPAGATAGPSTTDSAVYQDDYVKWLDTTYPSAKSDPQKTILYSLDNEPDLWGSTHAQVRAGNPSWQELTRLNVEYAAAIKDVVPEAKVFGPAHYGWDGMRNLQGGARPAGTSYTYFLDYYLDEMAKAERAQGRRLLDAFDFHWYPEAKSSTGVRIIDTGENAAMIEARVQAPRSLWDPTYIENSWIANGAVPECNGRCAIALLPRLKDHIAAHYPGTKLALTEYWYGGGNYISGAVAGADVLGILGREDVYAAALWLWGSAFSCVFAGWRAFLDYDGAQSRFGDHAVATTISDPQRTAASERVSAYGSIDPGSHDRAVVIAINKTAETLTAGVAVTSTRQYTRAEVYRVTSASAPTSTGCSGPTRQSDIGVSLKNAFVAALPPLSITVLVLRP